MKKIILIVNSLLFCGIINAQTVLYDNGPLVNMPGAGSGGADVSSLHDNMTLYGFNHSVAGGSKVAEDFIVPAAGWTVDSMIFYAYQTNSPTTSTITEVRMGIYDASPASGGNIIYGDTAMDALTYTEFTGIYRVTATTLTNTARPIMKNVVQTIGLVLTAGNYFVSWQTNGSSAFSGPWAPPVTYPVVTATGDGIQYTAASMMWNPAKDTSTTTGTGTGDIQGFPFKVYGHFTTVGIQQINSKDFGISNVYPVPAYNEVNFNYTTNNSGTILISLKDNLGRDILTQEKKVVAGENKITQNLSGYQSGIYFISVKSDEGYYVAKFMKN